jgi:G3E family GTPase
LRHLVRVEPTVVVVDAAGFFSLFQTLAYFYVTQLRSADVVVLNKADVATRNQLVEAEKEIRKIQPRAMVVRATRGRVDLRGILEGAPEAAQPGWQACRVRLEGTMDPAELRSFLERLPGGIYRAKGRVRFPDGVHRVEFLTGAYAQEAASSGGEASNELVFIGSRLDAPGLEERLKRCLLEAS